MFESMSASVPRLRDCRSITHADIVIVMSEAVNVF